MKIYYIDNNKTVDLTPRFPELTKEQELKLFKYGITALVLYKTCGSVNVFASTSGISEALNPIRDILMDLAEPVAEGMFIKGGLETMTGKEHEGKKTMKYAGAGFVGIQFIPQVMSIIKSIKLGG